MAYNQYDVANISLVKTGNLAEMYIPLWYYSIGYIGSQGTQPSGYYVSKGQTIVSGYGTSIVKLHTLSSNWSSSQKFALEASIYLNYWGGYPAYAELWDMTTNTAVTSSQISASVTSASATVVRSGQFTLTPGHIYGIALWVSGGSGYTAYLTKASLIAFLS
jgi:hypothetical protein